MKVFLRPNDYPKCSTNSDITVNEFTGISLIPLLMERWKSFIEFGRRDGEPLNKNFKRFLNSKSLCLGGGA